MIGDVNKKTKEELLEEFATKTSHNTLEGEQYTAAVMVKSAADIESAAKEVKDSIEQFEDTVRGIGESSDRLSGKLLWLNVVLTIATIIGAIATAMIAFK